MTVRTMQISVLRAAGAAAFAVLLLVGSPSCRRRPPATELPPAVDLTQAQDIFATPFGARSPETVLATVNGKPITEREVAAEAEQALTRLRRQLPAERVAQITPTVRRQALEGLIMRALLREAIEKEQVTVTDEEYQQLLERIRSTLPPTVTLEEHLARQNLDEATLREALRIDKLLREKAGEPGHPTDQEIAQFYEEHRERFDLPERVTASHILIAFAPDDDEQAKAAKRARAEEIRQKLLEGADFAEMARQYSDCPSKERGGDLGTFARGQMVPEFEQAAFSQAEGEIGPIIETRYGYHIVRVTKHESPKASALEDVRLGISRYLSAQVQQDRVEEYLDGLRQNAQIEYKEMP